MLVGCEATQRLEPARVVIGIEEELQVDPELVVALVVVAFDGRFFEGPVHALDLTIRPRMVRFCQAVLDVVLCADPVEDMHAVAGCRA